MPHNAEGKVVEYDAKGKAVWEVPFEQPIAAVRLPNGNTLITSMNPGIGAVEVDRAGTEVWSFRHSSDTASPALFGASKFDVSRPCVIRNPHPTPATRAP